MASHSHHHDPGHAHDHGHSHGHHHHAPASFGRAFAIGIGLNLAFVLIEAGWGYRANSTALMADAGHNLSDVLGLVVAWGGGVLASRPPKGRFTYGLRSSSILAALFNAIFLLVACGAIGLEAVQRLGRPVAVPGTVVMVVAAIGIAVNGVTAWLFANGAKGDINIRAAFAHMMVDALVSVGVVATGLLIVWTGWTWLDPLASLAVLAVILIGTWGLLKESVVMALAAAPRGIDLGEVEALLAALPGVTRVHDLHVWPMSTTEVALTAHLVAPCPCDSAFLRLAHDRIADKFGIRHSTLQVETDEDCAMAAGGTV